MKERTADCEGWTQESDSSAKFPTDKTKAMGRARYRRSPRNSPFRILGCLHGAFYLSLSVLSSRLLNWPNIFRDRFMISTRYEAGPFGKFYPSSLAL
ncbi:hypothetical protein M413DRAFT_289109 [Hebeloma cylindrosporum]|uniref:Uncharacterized protein n=1 Tax=Hebeloma cylindrosporum TaxID=76867 RepID=A0A0C3BYN9_HEBCY|nr:hypothetical protein M413DRAFT_289109 [Hebeloma cylindrosporum h7]